MWSFHQFASQLLALVYSVKIGAHVEIDQSFDLKFCETVLIDIVAEATLSDSFIGLIFFGIFVKRGVIKLIYFGIEDHVLIIILSEYSI